MLGNSNGMDEPDGDAGKTLNLARLACMDLAKLKGYIVERKQVKTATAHIRVDSMNRAQLREYMAQLLDQLEPGARAEMQRMIETDRFKPR